MVRHILANGREVKDITNYVVKLNDKTIVAYQLLAKKTQKGEAKC